MSEADYQQFLEGKFTFKAPGVGFTVTPEMVNPILKPHQRDTVIWAAGKGCGAVFHAFGLGKTPIQAELMRLCAKFDHGPTLTVVPLGVRGEFLKQDRDLGLGMDYVFIRRKEEMQAGHEHYLTNYESVRDGKLDPSLFNACTLDEASVLRDYGSKTYQEFLPLFKTVEHRFVATATPSPNRFKELIHYGAFVGAMDSGQALTRFFQRDSEKAGNLTLHPHMEAEFYAWLHSWALFLQKPSDIGYSDEGYDLPPLEVRWHKLPSVIVEANDKDGQGILIDAAAVGLTEACRVKRNSIDARVEKAREIVEASPDDHFIIWHTLEDERKAITQAIPQVVSVWGTQDMEKREKYVSDFADGEIKILSTKPSIAGSGCNFQRHCHRQIWAGIDYGFNDFIQGIHRCYRFNQTDHVVIDIIYTEAEEEIKSALMTKWENDKKLRFHMGELIRKHGLSGTGLHDDLKRTLGMKRVEAKGKFWTAVNNDCVEETRSMPENSVDLIVTSVPFGNQYEYSPSYNDFGHNPNNPAFFDQMDYLSPELLRVLRPGRVLAVHVKDRIRFGAVTGYGAPSVDPFHSDCIVHYRKHGFIYFGMVTVVTDVVRENNQTYRLGWSEQCKDGTKMGVGMPEYVLLFRKLQSDKSKGYADVPVEKAKDTYTRGKWQIDAHAFWRSSGERFMTAEELSGYGPDVLGKVFAKYSLERVYDYAEHVKLAEALDDNGRLPCTFMSMAPASHCDDVWHDVTRMRTLNADQVRDGSEKHVCPLQFDIVDRLIERYSNRGDLVYDPFGGIMTVPVRALKLGRRGLGCELSAPYFKDGLRYLKATEIEVASPTLFDMEDLVSHAV